jgi:hypothetical protein
MSEWLEVKTENEDVFLKLHFEMAIEELRPLIRQLEERGFTREQIKCHVLPKWTELYNKERRQVLAEFRAMAERKDATTH